jgi:hypothetical protein
VPRPLPRKAGRRLSDRLVSGGFEVENVGSQFLSLRQ